MLRRRRAAARGKAAAGGRKARDHTDSLERNKKGKILLAAKRERASFWEAQRQLSGENAQTPSLRQWSQSCTL